MLINWPKCSLGGGLPHVSNYPIFNDLIRVLRGEMSRTQLQEALSLKDRKHFREVYLAPSLAAALIEMTLPETPNMATSFDIRPVPSSCGGLATHEGFDRAAN